MTSGNLFVVVSPKVVRSKGVNIDHKSLLFQTMTALLHYNFLFMCGKGLNYIDLRSVLATDRSKGVQ